MNLLEGTPYSLPAEANGEIERMRRRLGEARISLRSAIEEARRFGLVAEVDRAHSLLSVFQSNRIEFEGPDLAGTVEAVEGEVGRDVLRNLSVELLPRVLQQDRRAFAAIGLELARRLALQFIGRDESRGVSEADLRGLHGVIMSGEWHAGAYRTRDVEIGGAAHKPVPTFDLPRKMQELSIWSQASFDPAESILRAAVGHAWFTHLHPFQDGNGRVARLFTNVMLGQDGLPPSIVKARSQRSRYLAALAHSDEGGDIMPLAGLFLETVERYVAELRKPQTFRDMFNDMVARRGRSYFEWYSAEQRGFLEALALELNVRRLAMEGLDDLSADTFAQLRAGGRENVMLAIVRGEDKYAPAEVLIYLRRPTLFPSGREESVPEIAFAVPNRRFHMHPYRRANRAELQGLSLLALKPGAPTKVIVDASSRRARSVGEAAEVVARSLRDGITKGFARAPLDYYGSARWLPTINGGPG